ncbi:MAG: hypothetical protein NTY96_01990 [Bacteroidetes bacterium]|nr:hypothetical protein [Bacteroidota bacterium]
MNKKLWLYYAAGFSFFMAVCQMIISLSPAAAAYFQGPPQLLADRWMLFFIGGAAAVLLAIGGLYALSGAGSIRHLPLLRVILVILSVIFLLRGLSVIRTILIFIGMAKGEILTAAWTSSLVFLAAGITYAAGTILNWKEMKVSRQA